MPTAYLSEAMDTSKAAPELQAKAAAVFPVAKKTIACLIDAGSKIATGTDAAAIPHGAELEGAVGARATRHAAGRRHRRVDGDERRAGAVGGLAGRLAPGYLADVIVVPGEILTEDIGALEHVNFVMKGGVVDKTPA